MGRQSRILTRAALVVSTAAIVAATFAGAAPGAGAPACAKTIPARIASSCPARAATPDALFSPLALLVSASPSVYGGGDIDLIAGRAQTSPHISQSTSQVWAHGNTVIAAYNDSESAAGSPMCLAGGSRSTDGGATWANTHPFCTDSNLGYPSVVYDPAVSKWLAAFLSASCGATGIGIWASTDDGTTWARTTCAHSGSFDDLESMWVDTKVGSPYYGRVYLTWNDFTVGSPIGAIRAIYSTDGGSTWSAPSTVFGSFRRNVGVTTSPGTDGTVFVAAMDEGGGGFAMHQNYVHRSTDGGVTWSGPFTVGSPFLGPGRALCNSYFPGMYTTPVSGFWRTMGWGDIGVGPSFVVHRVYASRPGTGDPGDIDYVRSTDNGVTWSAPLKLNTDAGTRGQWQPSLAVTPAGQVFVSWYDERNTTAENGYERFGRFSTNNGVSWLADSKVSDVVSPKPLQPDSSIGACDAGLYDRAYGGSGVFHTTWTDGRVAINAQSQENVFYDRVSSTPTAVRLASFTATRRTGGVALRWRTAAESGAVGFNVYREVRGRPAKLNRALIPTAGASGGHAYSWLDARAPAAQARYRLQVVSSSGARSWLGTARTAKL